MRALRFMAVSIIMPSLWGSSKLVVICLGRMKIIQEQIQRIRDELRELELILPQWENSAGGIDGSRRFRAISKRVKESAQRLDGLVKENTFSRR